jgi:hypothetical protein
LKLDILLDAGHVRSSLNGVSQHLNKDSQVVNRDLKDSGDACVPWWYQNARNPMDDPADDSLQTRAPGEQEPADKRRIVRRIEITVEREITTVILRRKDQSSVPTLPPKPPADKDSGDSF